MKTVRLKKMDGGGNSTIVAALTGVTKRTYILDPEGKPVHEPDLARWAIWFERLENRLLWHHELPKRVYVSTVFLGIDHRFLGRGPPVLWETMIFGGRHDGYQKRYSSRTEASKGHKAAVALAKGEVS